MAQEKIKQYIRSLDVDKKIIASIDNGILILDDKLKIYSFNKWLELHTDIKEDSIIGKRVDEVFEGINTKTLIRKIKTALRIGTPTFYTSNTSKYLIPIRIDQIGISNYSHMQQDVSIIPFNEEKSLVALIITDQTSMANINAQLEENVNRVEELNKELVKERDTIDKKVLLIKFDRDFIIKDISQAYLELIGYREDELLNKNLLHVEKSNISKELEEDIISHINTQTVFKFEYIVTKKDGKNIWISATQVPEYDTMGNHIGFILFKVDITDTKELHEHQNQMLLNSRSTAMGEMISMIAHQWRQPLSVISSILMNLKIEKELGISSEESIEEFYKDIEKTVNYLSETINDFTNFFKDDKIKTEVDVPTIFEKSMLLLRNSIQSNEIKYIQNISKELRISTYQNELIQVLINILKNSSDAFKDIEIADKYIAVNASSDEEYVYINIKDNAGGIKEDIINRVFEPYFSTKSKNGTGLGLYMSKKIIEENLCGNISVKSQNGSTEFLIKIPLCLT